MPLAGANRKRSVDVSELRPSEYTPTYMSPDTLVRATELTVAELAKNQDAEITGKAAERLLADIFRADLTPEKGNRPVPDLYRHGVPYSIKAIQLRWTASRPLWEDWRGHPVTLLTHRMEPAGLLPRGRTIFDTRVDALGRRLIENYNVILEEYRHEMLAVFAGLRVESEQLRRYFYWEEELQPLDPADFIWHDRKPSNPAAAKADKGKKHNIWAERRDRPAGEKRADLAWCSKGSQLYVRHHIPADVDTWVVPDAKALTREEATTALLDAARVKALSR
jgi:hypothetical protein